MRNTFVPMFIAGAILGIALARPACALQSDLPSQSQQPRDTNDQKAARRFNGRVEKSGHKLVLQETSSNAVYQLDDQDKAKQFAGKTVKVTGTLDSASGMIRVSAIEPGA